MERIQIISILVSLLFLCVIAYYIYKGKLREEYAFVWIGSTVLLILFSIWRNAFEVLAKEFGVYSPPNLIFTGAIFAVLIYLLHLSVVLSKLHKQNKTMAQEIAILNQKLEERKK